MDMKVDNITLDFNDKGNPLTARIADLGLAKRGELIDTPYG